jgi:hypothetical protein
MTVIVQCILWWRRSMYTYCVVIMNRHAIWYTNWPVGADDCYSKVPRLEWGRRGCRGKIIPDVTARKNLAGLSIKSTIWRWRNLDPRQRRFLCWFAASILLRSTTLGWYILVLSAFCVKWWMTWTNPRRRIESLRPSCLPYFLLPGSTKRSRLSKQKTSSWKHPVI